MIRKLAVLFLALASGMSLGSEGAQPVRAEGEPFRYGVYQSAPLAWKIPGASKDETYRLFLRLLPSHKAAIVISPMSAEQIAQRMVEGSDMAGDYPYTVIHGGLEFQTGTTRHSLSRRADGTVLLRSEYANVRVTENVLTLAVADGF